MANINQSIKLGSGFLLKGAPVDLKVTAATLEERNSYVTENALYQGALVYVVETDKFYKYTGVAPTDNDFSACFVDLLGDVALDTTVVKTNGDQTIEGVKNFLSAPTVAGEAVATLKEVESKVSEVTGSIGEDIQAHSAQLDALAAFDATGYVFRKADGSFVGGTVSAKDATVSVDSVDGVTTIGLPASGVTAGAFTKVTVNAQGIVTAGANPTTLEGYGITDAVAKDAQGNVAVAGKLTVTGETTVAKVTATEVVAPKVSADEVAVKALDVAEEANFMAAPTITTKSLVEGQPDKVETVATKEYVDAQLSVAELTFADSDYIALSEADGTVTAQLKDSTVQAGAYTKVTVDAKGIVTAGENPTTLAGYGITDALLRLDATEAQAVEGAVDFGGLTIATKAVATEEFVTQAIADAEDNVADSDSIAMSKVGDVITAELKDSGVVAGTYGNITVNAKGIVTGAKDNVLVVDGDEAGVQEVNGRIALVGVASEDFEANDLVTRQFVENIASGHIPHKAVEAVAKDNITGQYTSGDTEHPGVGAKFVTSVTTIDGVAIEQGHRYLLIGQTDKKQNGVYLAETVGAQVTLVRAEDLDGNPNEEIYVGSSFLVLQGTLGGTIWALQNHEIVFGESEISFAQVGAPNQTNAGAGLKVEGNTISVVEGATVQVIDGKLEVSSGTGNATKVLVAGADGTAATFQTLDLNVALDGTVAVAKGGTGVETIAKNELVIGNGVDPISTIANAEGVLVGSASGAPAFGKVDVTKHIEGIVAVANGGTGVSAFEANALMIGSADGKALAHVANAEGVLVGNANGAPAFGKVALASAVEGVLPLANGGMGVANTDAKDIKVGDFEFKTEAGSVVTVPATGTLATLAGVETLSNKTLVAPVATANAEGVAVEAQGVVKVKSTVAATSSSSAALTVSGGVGVAGDVVGAVDVNGVPTSKLVNFVIDGGTY